MNLAGVYSFFGDFPVVLGFSGTRAHELWIYSALLIFVLSQVFVSLRCRDAGRALQETEGTVKERGSSRADQEIKGGVASLWCCYTFLKRVCNTFEVGLRVQHAKGRGNPELLVQHSRGAYSALEGLLTLVLAAGYSQESPISLGKWSVALCGVCTGTSVVPEVLSWPWMLVFLSLKCPWHGFGLGLMKVSRTVPGLDLAWARDHQKGSLDMTSLF